MAMRITKYECTNKWLFILENQTNVNQFQHSIDFILVNDSMISSPIIIELDYGKIYRKALYLMVKTMVSCKFPLKPIQ